MTTRRQFFGAILAVVSIPAMLQAQDVRFGAQSPRPVFPPCGGHPTNDRKVRIVSGHCSANDSEIDEGYLAIGQKTQLMVEPKSVTHDIIRTLKGKVIDLWAEVIG